MGNTYNAVAFPIYFIVISVNISKYLGGAGVIRVKVFNKGSKTKIVFKVGATGHFVPF